MLRHTLFLLLIPILICFLSVFPQPVLATTSASRPETAIINDHGLQFVVSLEDVATVSDLLLRENLALSESDTLFPPLSSPVTAGSIIYIRRAIAVHVHDFQNGAQTDTTYLTQSSRVEDVISELHIELGPSDVVDPSPSTILFSDIDLDIIRVTSDSLTKTVSLPFPVIEQKDPTLLQGKTSVAQQGIEGEKVLQYSLVYNNDQLVSKTLIDEQILREPVPKILLRGTKPPVKDTQAGRASWYGAPSMTAAHRTYPFGSRVRVINVQNGKSVVITIADRGPYIDGRIIDLSKDAYSAIAPLGSGTVDVRIELLAD